MTDKIETTEQNVDTSQLMVSVPFDLLAYAVMTLSVVEKHHNAIIGLIEKEAVDGDDCADEVGRILNASILGAALMKSLRAAYPPELAEWLFAAED